jgi:hypothetical protein
MLDHWNPNYGLCFHQNAHGPGYGLCSFQNMFNFNYD